MLLEPRDIAPLITLRRVILLGITAALGLIFTVGFIGLQVFS